MRFVHLSTSRGRKDYHAAVSSWKLMKDGDRTRTLFDRRRGLDATAHDDEDDESRLDQP